jgi:hypothetical protein
MILNIRGTLKKLFLLLSPEEIANIVFLYTHKCTSTMDFEHD